MKQKFNIPFSPPDMTEAEVNAAAEVIRSGWITTGPKTKQFEKEIAAYCDAPRAVCLNSQTACAEMALRLLGIGEGDEFITSAYTYSASASVACHVGAKLVLVDVQKDNLEMDYDKLEAAITEKTKVIVPVDIGGVPCDYDRIFDIVERKKHLFRPANPLQEAIGRIIVLEDASHALGGEYHGKKLGNISDFTAFSFHAVKNLTTAEGGALTWRNFDGIDTEDIYHRLQLLSLHGQSKDALAKSKLGAWEYDIIGPWFKCNMTDILASIGIVQLHRYEDMLARRKEIVAKYDSALKPLGINVLPHEVAGNRSSYHLYIARIPGIESEQRNEIITKMAEAGIACNVHYKPLPMHTAYKSLGFDIADYPNAYNQFKCEVTLPLHTHITDEEADYIVESFTEIIKCY